MFGDCVDDNVACIVLLLALSTKADCSVDVVSTLLDMSDRCADVAVLEIVEIGLCVDESVA